MFKGRAEPLPMQAVEGRARVAALGSSPTAVSAACETLGKRQDLCEFHRALVRVAGGHC